MRACLCVCVCLFLCVSAMVPLRQCSFQMLNFVSKLYRVSLPNRQTATSGIVFHSTSHTKGNLTPQVRTSIAYETIPRRKRSTSRLSVFLLTHSTFEPLFLRHMQWSLQIRTFPDAARPSSLPPPPPPPPPLADRTASLRGPKMLNKKQEEKNT